MRSEIQQTEASHRYHGSLSSVELFKPLDLRAAITAANVHSDPNTFVFISVYLVGWWITKILNERDSNYSPSPRFFFQESHLCISKIGFPIISEKVSRFLKIKAVGKMTYLYVHSLESCPRTIIIRLER